MNAAPEYAEVRFVPNIAEHKHIAAICATSAEGVVMIQSHSGDCTSPPADRVICTPGVCGGEPRIAGTRIPVRVLAAYREQGCSDDDLLADFPSLSSEDLVAAWVFVDNNPAR